MSSWHTDSRQVRTNVATTLLMVEVMLRDLVQDFVRQFLVGLMALWHFLGLINLIVAILRMINLLIIANKRGRLVARDIAFSSADGRRWILLSSAVNWAMHKGLRRAVTVVVHLHIRFVAWVVMVDRLLLGELAFFAVMI